MTDPKKIYENFEANISDVMRMLTGDEEVDIDIHKGKARITVFHRMGETSEEASYTWRAVCETQK